MNENANADILIVGSGMGGATLAAGLAPTGARILILERGEQLPDTSETRDARAIFQRGVYRPAETWIDGAGAAFNPGNYYYVGGNSKFYGAVLFRYRAQDFRPIAHAEGTTPGWPFDYDEMEPWYSRAEALYQVRGALGEDPTEPRHSAPYPFPPVPDEPAIAAARQRMTRVGLHPASLPLGVDIDAWLKRAATPWDAYPDARSGKMDAETCGLASALSHANVTLRTGAQARRLLMSPDGRQVEGVEYLVGGESRVAAAKIVVLAAGAVNSAVLLLRSAERGVANRSGMVGRHFMNHNLSAVIAIDPRAVNDSVYQKTLSINDFYLDDGRGGPPLGNIQLLGRVTGPILKSDLKWVPEGALNWISRHAVDWLAMSEDLPDPDSRVTVDGDRDPPGLEAQQLGCPPGVGVTLARTIARRRLSHRAGPRVRPPDAFASMRDGAHRRRMAAVRRSIRSVAPGTTRISSSSMLRSCRPRPRSIQR